LDKTYPDKYKEFNTFHNTKQQLILPYVKLSIELLERFGVDTSEFNISNDPIKNIKNVVMNYLIIGRNCGDCCYIEHGDKIREQYISQTKEQLGMG
jgi:hypothetical protein